MTGGIRRVVVGVGAGIAIGLYFAVSLRVNTFLAVGVGAFVAILLLLIAGWLSDDPARADAAWRAAAPDLRDRPADLLDASTDDPPDRPHDPVGPGPSDD